MYLNWSSSSLLLFFPPSPTVLVQYIPLPLTVLITCYMLPVPVRTYVLYSVTTSGGGLALYRSTCALACISPPPLPPTLFSSLFRFISSEIFEAPRCCGPAAAAPWFSSFSSLFLPFPKLKRLALILPGRENVGSNIILICCTTVQNANFKFIFQCSVSSMWFRYFRMKILTVHIMPKNNIIFHSFLLTLNAFCFTVSQWTLCLHIHSVWLMILKKTPT